MGNARESNGSSGRDEEAAIEPELPLCDPHHHLWERPGSCYLQSELLADVRDHRVEQTVYVECGHGG
ncbi:MAG: hypothetical protein P8Q97_08450 [Myxococcota bacterium]|nr:hypothetical protein [Myxococcota bacterium]